MDKVMEKEFKYSCRLKVAGSAGGLVTRFTCEVMAKNKNDAWKAAEAKVLKDSFANQFYPAEGAEIECELQDE